MHSPLRLLPVLMLAVTCLLWHTVSRAQPMPSFEPEAAEYMIYQYPGMTLVVIVDVREAGFETHITGPEGALVSEAMVPGRRVGPVYQFIGPVNTPRQLMVGVRPEQAVQRSRISMKLLQFPEYDPNAQLQARAYRLLSHGMERVYTPSGATWAERTSSLGNAARVFASMGNEEMQLWSEYYAAHVVLHGIGDVLLARERARRVQAAARRAGLPVIELLSVLLEAESLMQEAERSSGEQALSRYEQAHPLWEQVAAMAEVQGLENERGRALYRDGVAYERQGRLEPAIDRYEQALAVIAPGPDQELLNTVRATAAAAYERSGSTSGALGMLDDITGDLSERGETAMALELAHNLYEKGRLLNETFRFVEALPVLERALALQVEHAGADSGPTGLELGWSQYALGEFNAAEESLREALARTPGARASERYRALGALASIAREQGRHREAAEFRERQQRADRAGPARAAFLYDSAIDARARGETAEALRLLGEARRVAVGNDRLTAHRARLQQCLLRREGGTGSCTPQQARDSLEALEHGGIPTLEVEAGLAWVRLLQNEGRHDRARAYVNGLLDTVQFYRERLPGVIAHWHAVQRGELYRAYLELARDVSGLETLVALERIRRLESIVPHERSPEDALRASLQRVVAAQPTVGDTASREAHGAIDAFREREGWRNDMPSSAEIRDALARLERGTTVLAFDFSADRVHAVSGTREGARLHRLADSSGIRGRLGEAWSALQARSPAPDVLLDRLGDDLLAPLADRVGETILLMPSGPLQGFPLDVVRVEGRYLAARHRLVNIDSVLGVQPALEAFPGGFGQQVYVAGNPRAGRELFSYGVTTSREIDAVRDQFVGDGLHIVQGVALRRDEFQDGRYANASLIHLSMPGRVDLARPDRSRLLLSGERETPSAEFLGPADLRAIPVRADLAVLGGTAFVGRDAPYFASRLGLIHDLHRAGASRVVASLWPLEDERSAAFMQAFYSRLEQEKDAAKALHQTRKAFLAAENGDNLAQWAGFQLFIR